MAATKLKIGCAGLGRMGKRHALNFLQRTPRAELVAASSPDDAELEWAKVHLEPYGVKLYKNYDDMLRHEGLEAVVVASATAVHAEQAIKAIDAEKHVLCEKPLSTSVEIVFMRSQTCDKLDPSGFFVAYAQFSGGIFVDCSIHDIDLALWFFGQDSKVKSVSAVGITAVEPDLRKHNDRDNAVGLVEFHNGKIAYFYASRMMAAGQEDTTEIIGTQGKLAVNTQPALNLVSIYDSTGIRREIPQHYYDRFEYAFVTEANEFTACCLENTPVPLRLDGAVQAVRIGAALQESLITGEKIFFDEEGNRVDKSRL
ncbi:unnamed protein product [Aspergillus oryzae]|uniref:Unnamed protein product n=2 Tax=Aspergillus oryzae TaxID=5062 RepID=A0AAN5C0U0_ASPOZ|nr:unnamed protein product [Aspergillus oryzae]GMF95589.1 unnamed protein product [Aspergillus oryzae]GMG09240.1 unnamed protein product [Aspergillus oryzae]GMG34761.1 unnamed protein product [Aspergillus oryzae]GMG53225.1 unnamed protein product [Aspergillus oryzae var. brunneus]